MRYIENGRAGCMLCAAVLILGTENLNRKDSDHGTGEIADLLPRAAHGDIELIQITTGAFRQTDVPRLRLVIGGKVRSQAAGQPEQNGGYRALNTGSSSYGKLDERIYSELSSDHPIDQTRYQVANCYMGRAGLINSGGGSSKNDLQQAVRTAVINKRAGGMGLISGRKAFQKPMRDGVELLNAIQDVFLNEEVTIA